MPWFYLNVLEHLRYDIFIGLCSERHPMNFIYRLIISENPQSDDILNDLIIRTRTTGKYPMPQPSSKVLTNWTPSISELPSIFKQTYTDEHVTTIKGRLFTLFDSGIFSPDQISTIIEIIRKSREYHMFRSQKGTDPKIEDYLAFYIDMCATSRSLSIQKILLC